MAKDVAEVHLGRSHWSFRGLEVQAMGAPETDFCEPVVFMRLRK